MNLFKQPWHFDKFRVDEDGEYVKCIGHFQGDWDADIIAARDVGVQDQPYNKQDYGHAANAKSKDHVEEDKENPDGKPEAVMFRKINFDKKAKLFASISSRTLAIRGLKCNEHIDSQMRWWI